MTPAQFGSLTPRQVDAMWREHYQREISQDARLTACAITSGIVASMTKRDSSPWSIADFLPGVMQARLHPKATLDAAVRLSTEERAARNIENMDRMANRIGFEATDMSPEEWAEIQRKEAERMASIHNS